MSARALIIAARAVRAVRSAVVSAALLPMMLALMLGLLGGCSAVRLGYGQAPELAYWWLDGYVDFDDAQTPRVRAALADWFAWHRRTQLPDYADLLARAQADALADTTAERACEWFEVLRSRFDRAVEQGLPQAAELIATLTPEQLRHIERRHEKNNRDFREEYLADDAAQRLDDSVERTIGRAETLYGRLDEAQRKLVARWVAQSPFDPELWLSERRRRQQDALQLLRDWPADKEAAQAALRAYAARLQHSPREVYRRYAQRLQTYNCAFAAALHNASGTTQRQATVQKLKGWENDLRALAADAH